MNIAIAFEPDLLKVMSTFSAFDATLKKYIATATEKSGVTIADSIQGHQHWFDPTPVLSESFGVEMVDEYNAYIGSPVVYGPRRNWGFEGGDSLGRLYHDEGAFFMEVALDDESMLFEVASNYVDAVYGAWNECVGGLPMGVTAFAGIV